MFLLKSFDLVVPKGDSGDVSAEAEPPQCPNSADGRLVRRHSAMLWSFFMHWIYSGPQGQPDDGISFPVRSSITSLSANLFADIAPGPALHY